MSPPAAGRTLTARELASASMGAGASSGDDALADAEEVYLAHEAFDALAPDALATCRSLSSLRLSRNGLRALPSLHASASTIVTLELSHQRLASMRGLGAMPRLRELVLNDNDILEIESLDRCPRLRRLCLFSNRIRRVSGLDALGELRELWLQDNDVRQLGPDALVSCVNLRAVALAGNPIRRLRDATDALAAVPTLAEVSFADARFAPAPCASEPGYEAAVLSSLPRLVVLDETRVGALEEGGALEEDGGEEGEGEGASPSRSSVASPSRSRASGAALRGAVDRGEADARVLVEHEARVAVLESARRTSLASANAARTRASAKLRALERTLRRGREAVVAAAAAAAARRDAARERLRLELDDLAAEYARVTGEMVARRERAAAREEAAADRRRRRAAFRADELAAYARVEGAASLSAESTSTTRADPRGVEGSAPTCVFELEADDPEAIALAREVAAAAGAAGELTARGAAAAVVAAAAGAATLGRAFAEGEPKPLATFGPARDVGGGVAVLAAFRIVHAEAARAFDEAVRKQAAASEASEASEASDEASAAPRWGFVGLAPSEARSAVARGIEAAARGGTVTLHRSAASAYAAAKMALASAGEDDRTTGEDGGGSDGGGADGGGSGGASARAAARAAALDGPATVLAARFLASAGEASAWDRAPSGALHARRRGGGAGLPTRGAVVTVAAARANVRYALHVERVARSGGGGGGGSGGGGGDEDGAGGVLSESSADRFEFDFAREDAEDAARLDALDAKAEAAARAARRDAWADADARVASAAAERDEEARALREELRRTLAAVAAERAAQDALARARREEREARARENESMPAKGSWNEREGGGGTPRALEERRRR